MCRVYESSYANPKFRSGCDLAKAPMQASMQTESELAEITATNLKERRHWSPPAPMSLILSKLCDQLRGGTEPTPEEPASVEEPASA